ncbi:MAG: TonB-dependent receptor [Burkholderiaceae bacterium]|nr:TonB-dependent receptor [Burkholderiaceae bacterium]
MATRSLVLAMAAAAAWPTLAQDTPQTVTVTGRAPPSAAIGGFDDVPLSRAPFGATVFSPTALTDAGITSLADVTRISAGVNDAYNAVGYWSSFSVRGYRLDERTNYRRDGLPINAETALWLGNKSALEVLRGTSGIQAGVSAPGGLINLLVKRPNGTRRVATLGFEESGTHQLALDLGDRAGPDGAIGWRINAEHERLDPLLRSSRGKRQGLAAALEWRLGADARLEAEVELNRQSQPSQAGFSLLGNTVPDADTIDPRLNLNNQPWSLPVVFSGRTASLRWTQRLARDLNFVAHAMTQRLRTDDRIAFPFGCSAENNFDRYCSDGSFDLYDFRSEGERRRNEAVDLSLGGRSMLWTREHRWRAGVLWWRQQADLPPQAFNFVGVGTIDGSTVLPSDPTLSGGSARDQRHTEWYLRDQWVLTPTVNLWLGLRHTRIESTDSGSAAIEGVSQTFTTPWVAASLQLDPRTLVYASAGQGIETTVTPNLPTYENPNQPLPALKSRQLEAGIKHDAGPVALSAIAFDIRKPLFSDLCPALCTRVLDGRQRHRGVEFDATWRQGAWTVEGSATALKARRERSQDPADDGRKPTNVPERSLSAQASYQLLALPELTLTAGVKHEGSRIVLPDNSAGIPSWTTLDLGARLVQRKAGTTLTWRLGVENATDKRAWRESPYQFSHAYLYPLAPRTWRASVQAAF